MADIVSPDTRSRMMSGIRGKNTRPEMQLRTALHKMGFRYRLHVRSLPGSPDMVFPRYEAVVLVHGCFWHRHDCHLFKWPKSRTEFWREKIEGNARRDLRNEAELLGLGWRVLTIWECALKGKTRLPFAHLIDITASWVRSDSPQQEIRGHE